MTTKEKALDTACLIATTGSIAYGLNHSGSDLDQMGVFIASTSEVAGLDWSARNESWTNTSPEGDDLTMHEIGKYLRLCLGGNPTLIELLFMNEYDVLTGEGENMVYLRDYIISESTLRKSYAGYAKSQFFRVGQDDPFKPKMARHTLRIARQGISLLTTGSFNVRVENPQEYFDLTEMPKEVMFGVIEKELKTLENCKSVIREYPDRDRVSEYLKGVRIREYT